MSDLDNFRDTKKALDAISPSMCLAKWKQVTLHLHNGHTHSCHHPDTHKVPLSEIAKDPSALHNTQFKKRLRKSMLEGKRPKECDHCWRIEDASSDSISDRIIKSADEWAKPSMSEVANSAWNQNVDPTYLEVNFGSLCNMKCSYCLPHISSSWMDELKEHGPYLTSTLLYSIESVQFHDKMPAAPGANPYLEAFWKWWPELYPKLKVLRITGGEPLLSPDTFKVMDFVSANPRSDLDLSVNSNLMVPQHRIDQFLERAVSIQKLNAVKRFGVYASVDTWGKRAEYIRFGMRHSYFWNNVEKTLAAFKDFPQSSLTLMCTFNALSIGEFDLFLDHVLKLRAKYGNIHLDISYLRHPEHQSLKILPPSNVARLDALLDFMEANSAHKNGARDGFSEFEIEKFRRICAWVQKPESASWLARFRKDFYLFFSEHDRRRKTNFAETFPEMKDFWAACASLAGE